MKILFGLSVKASLIWKRNLAIGKQPAPEFSDIWPPSPNANGPNSGKIWQESDHDQKPV
jgi:hypothetical protein